MKVLPRSAHVFKKDKIEQQNPGDKQAKNLEAFTALFDVLLKWNYHAWCRECAWTMWWSMAEYSASTITGTRVRCLAPSGAVAVM